MAGGALAGRNAEGVVVYGTAGIEVATGAGRHATSASLAGSITESAYVQDQVVLGGAGRDALVVLEVEGKGVVAGQTVGGGGPAGQTVGAARVAVAGRRVGNVAARRTRAETLAVVEVGSRGAGKTVGGSGGAGEAGRSAAVALLVASVGEVARQTGGHADIVDEVEEVGGGAGGAVGAGRYAGSAVGVAGGAGGPHQEEARRTGAGAGRGVGVEDRKGRD